MKESKFIDQNKEKWLGFERLLKSDNQDPDKLSEFFIKITDDLSYARTFYNNRTIRVYLNNICQQLFYLIYKSPKKRVGNAFVTFWKSELPTIAYESRREMLVSFLVFFLAVAIGVVSAVHDPDFVRVILGDEYVSMTIENIESGDPMAVYKKMNEVDMFLGISFNNLRVSLITFLFGILWAAGSIIILLYNGIMVGAFQYFFIEKGLFLESFLTIWLHGTLEMSAIVIAGASGIVLGKGIIAPGSYSRLQAFQMAAKRGAKLFLGIVPIIVMAAVIESFLTRYTDIPDFIRLILIFISLFYMIFYFGWYPRFVNKSGNSYREQHTDLQATPNFEIPYFGKIRTAGEVLRDSFLFYRKHGGTFIRINFIAAIAYMLFFMVYVYPSLSFYTYGYEYIDWLTQMSGFFFDHQSRPYMMLFNAAFFAVHSLFIVRIIFSDVNVSSPLTRKRIVSFLLYAFLTNLALYSIDLMNAGVQVLVSFFVSPIFTLALFILVQESKLGFGSLLQRVKFLMKGNYGFLLGLTFLIYLITFAGYFFMNSPFPLFYIDFINWNIQVDAETMDAVVMAINGFLSIFSILITIPIFLFGISMAYFNFLEIHEANALKERIGAFRKKTV